MKHFRIVFFLIAFSTVVGIIISCAFQRPGNPEYGWLNGKWRGLAPSGGELMLGLQVVNANEVVGSATIEGTHIAPAKISGSVNGEKVELSAYKAHHVTTSL